MLTERDLILLKWVNKYGVITISQSQYLFFNGSYEASRRRLSILEDCKLIRSYISKTTKQKVYYTKQKKNDSYLYVLDYITVLKKANCEILDVKFNPKYLDKSVKPSAFVKFKINKYVYNTILQLNDFDTYDSLDINNFYSKLSKCTNLYPEFNNHNFILVLISSVKSVGINSPNFDCIFTNTNFSNLISLLDVDKLLCL